VDVFPNPTNDVLNILFEEQNQDFWGIQLTDLTGRILLEKNKLTEQVFELNLPKENLSKGIYFLTIKIENKGKVVRKIIFTE